MEILFLLKSLGSAVLLGALVGIEREKKGNGVFGVSHFAGLRTFSLIGLLGALGTMVSDLFNDWMLLGVLSIGFFMLLTAAYFLSAKDGKEIGITTEVAALLVYLIGILCGLGRFTEGTLIAIALVMILHFKSFLHAIVQEITEKEISAAIFFLIVSFVVLPILPNENFGILEFFNPYLTWLMVVLISGISFVSYLAIKFLGPTKGIGLTGFLAGFISSTALTFSYSGESKKNSQIINPYVLAVLVASTAMFFRVMLTVSVVNRDLLTSLYVPILAMGVTGILWSFVIFFKKEKVPAKVVKEIKNMESPFALLPALKFGLLFLLILLITKVAEFYLGDSGVYITSVVSGVMDVDAITISLANMAKNGDISNELAKMGITIATITNTMAKGVIFVSLGNRKAGLKLMKAMIVISCVGGVSLFLS